MNTTAVPEAVDQGFLRIVAVQYADPVTGQAVLDALREGFLSGVRYLTAQLEENQPQHGPEECEAPFLAHELEIVRAQRDVAQAVERQRNHERIAAEYDRDRTQKALAIGQKLAVDAQAVAVEAVESVQALTAARDVALKYAAKIEDRLSETSGEIGRQADLIVKLRSNLVSTMTKVQVERERADAFKEKLGLLGWESGT